MLDAPVTPVEVAAPDTKKPGHFASLPKWVKVLLIAVAALLALAFIGSLNKDPIPAAAPTRSPAPVAIASTPASTISDAKLHQLALGMAWDQQGATAQSDMCFAATTLGYSWAANTIVSGSGNAFTVTEVTSFLHSKC